MQSYPIPVSSNVLSVASKKIGGSDRLLGSGQSESDQEFSGTMRSLWEISDTLKEEGSVSDRLSPRRSDSLAIGTLVASCDPSEVRPAGIDVLSVSSLEAPFVVEDRVGVLFNPDECEVELGQAEEQSVLAIEGSAAAVVPFIQSLFFDKVNPVDKWLQVEAASEKPSGAALEVGIYSHYCGAAALFEADKVDKVAGSFRLGVSSATPSPPNAPVAICNLVMQDEASCLDIHMSLRGVEVKVQILSHEFAITRVMAERLSEIRRLVYLTVNEKEASSNRHLTANASDTCDRQEKSSMVLGLGPSRRKLSGDQMFVDRV